MSQDHSYSAISDFLTSFKLSQSNIDSIFNHEPNTKYCTSKTNFSKNFGCWTHYQKNANILQRCGARIYIKASQFGISTFSWFIKMKLKVMTLIFVWLFFAPTVELRRSPSKCCGENEESVYEINYKNQVCEILLIRHFSHQVHWLRSFLWRRRMQYDHVHSTL